MEGVAMIGMVLVLAGVTAGDGGLRAGAWSEPVAVSLEGRWEGTLRREGWADPFPCVWDNTAHLLRLGDHGALTGRATAVRAGAAVVEAGGATYRGTYTLRGRTLTLRVANDRDRLVFTLKPTDCKS
jgi:hypothetical protein